MQDLTELVQQASSENKNLTQRHLAFGELVNRFQEMAYHVAYGVVGESTLAQDVVQEAFVSAYHKLFQLRDPKAFPGWFKQIILSQCHRLLRAKRPLTTLEDTYLITSDPDPAQTLEQAEIKEKVLEAIQALPEGEQEITQLFYLLGYSQKEIAKSLELPLTTVKKRLQYARRNLRGLLLTFFGPDPVPEPIPVFVHDHRPAPTGESEW